MGYESGEIGWSWRDEEILLLYFVFYGFIFFGLLNICIFGWEIVVGNWWRKCFWRNEFVLFGYIIWRFKVRNGFIVWKNCFLEDKIIGNKINKFRFDRIWFE